MDYHLSISISQFIPLIKSLCIIKLALDEYRNIMGTADIPEGTKVVEEFIKNTQLKLFCNCYHVKFNYRMYEYDIKFFCET